MRVVAGCDSLKGLVDTTTLAQHCEGAGRALEAAQLRLQEAESQTEQSAPPKWIENQLHLGKQLTRSYRLRCSWWRVSPFDCFVCAELIR